MMASASPFQTRILIGLLVSLVLIFMAAILLAQLVIFPQSTSASNIWPLNDRIVRTLIFTTFQATLSTLLSLAIGMALAWSLARIPVFPFRRLLVSLISTALVLPTLVIVLGLVTIYGRNGWISQTLSYGLDTSWPFSIYGLAGILMAHTYFNASFAARIFMNRFEAIPPEKYKLSLSLGLGFTRRIRYVEWPAIRGSITGVAITVFLLCFTSFAIVLTLGGSPAYNTLEVAIYEAVRFEFDLPRAFDLALIQIIICLFLVLVSGSRNQFSIADITVGSNYLSRHLYPRVERNVQWLVIVFFAVFFILPLLATLVDGFGFGFLTQFADEQFMRALANSLIIAFSSTLLALFVAFAIAQATASLSLSLRIEYSGILRHFLRNSRLNRLVVALLNLSSMIYLVFPALVMGLGFFLLHQKFGGNTDIWAGFVVTVANALIAVPFAIALLRPAIVAQAKKHDRLCLSLGLGGWQRWRIIDWTALRPDLTYAAALSFCFSMGDLGVIALFGSDEFRTLPWLLYQKFGSYRTDEAASIALLLLLIIVTLFWISQLPDKSGERSP